MTPPYGTPLPGVPSVDTSSVGAEHTGRTWRDVLAWTGTGLFSGALLFALAGLALSVESVADRVGMERVAAIPASAGGFWLLLLLVAVVGLVVPQTAVTASDREGASEDDTVAVREGAPQHGAVSRHGTAAPEEAGPTPPTSHRLVDTLLLAAGAVTTAVLAVWSFPPDALFPTSIHVHGYTETEVLLWACTVVLALAGLLAIVAGRPPRSGTGSRTLPVVAVTAGALTVALVAGAAGSVTHPRVMHTVAADDLEDPPADLAGVHGPGWTWQPPSGVRVEGVEAGPRGPVLLLQDGFIALNGATGEELWTYRELHTEELEAQLHEGVAALIHRPEDRAAREVLLDPRTGELIAERPAAHDLSSYVGSVSLHESGQDTRAVGFEARTLEPGATGSGEPLWSFAPQERGMFCAFHPGRWPKVDPATGDGLVVLAHACADTEEIKDRTLEGTGLPIGVDEMLAHGLTLDSLAVTITALDLANGREVWRHEQPVTGSWSHLDLETVDRSPLAEGDAHTLRFGADSELFLFNPWTGEPLGYPEEAHDPDGSLGMEVEVLRADTGGTVLMLRSKTYPYEGYFSVLTADPAGEITARVTVDERGLSTDLLEHAVVLTDTLLIPYVDRVSRERLVYSVPLAAGDLGGEWLEADLPPTVSDNHEHRLLAVPGAVLSYSTSGSTEIHGLVP